MESEPVELRTSEAGAEFTVANGCILCGGEISFRVTPKGAFSCCVSCRWLSNPHVGFEKSGLHVEYQPSGRA